MKFINHTNKVLQIYQITSPKIYHTALWAFLDLIMPRSKLLPVTFHIDSLFLR